jgi:hypothetical protein
VARIDIPPPPVNALVAGFDVPARARGLDELVASLEQTAEPIMAAILARSSAAGWRSRSLRTTGSPRLTRALGCRTLRWA